MSKLNKTEKEALKAWFNEWVQTIDERINHWLASLPEHYQQQLDKSEESLKVLGEYVANQYSNPRDSENLAFAQEFDAIATYIGEVHRMNYPKAAKWKACFESGPLGAATFSFRSQICMLGCKGGKNPFDQIPYVINMKKTEAFYNSLKGNQKSLQEFIDAQNAPKIPGNGGEAYTHRCLIVDDTFDFSTLDKVLNNFFKKHNYAFTARFFNEKRLLIDIGKGYYFHFYLDESATVQSGVKEILSEYQGDKDKNLIKQCHRQLIFWGDGDKDVEYFNYHLYILDDLVTLPSFYIYSEINRTFFDEV